MRLAFFHLRAVLFITVFLVGVVSLGRVNIIQAWEEGVKIYRDCQNWKVKAYPKPFQPNSKTKWVPVEINGTGEGSWQSDQTEQTYIVTVKWQKLTRECKSWRRCSDWEETDTYYEESKEGSITKPRKCDKPTPTPTEPPEETPDPTPEPEEPEEEWVDPNTSALANDHLQCSNDMFDAVVDLKTNGNPVKDVLVKFDFNGELKEAKTNEDGRARVQFPIEEGTVYIEAENFPDQSQVIIPPDCGDEDEGVGGGDVLGVSTMAETGSQEVFSTTGLLLAGLSVSAASAYGYTKAKKN